MERKSLVFQRHSCNGRLPHCHGFLAVIGKRFADAGLRDIVVESGVAGPSSVLSTMSGKHYNRGVRTHQIVVEAFFRLLWKKFEALLTSQDGGLRVTGGAHRS